MKQQMGAMTLPDSLPIKINNNFKKEERNLEAGIPEAVAGFAGLA